jgi:naphthoate synthase
VGREILGHSPLAIRLLKSGLQRRARRPGGIQELAGNATLLYYMSEEAKEFHSAQKEKREKVRKPNAFSAAQTTSQPLSLST